MCISLGRVRGNSFICNPSSCTVFERGRRLSALWTSTVILSLVPQCSYMRSLLLLLFVPLTGLAAAQQVGVGRLLHRSRAQQNAPTHDYQ